MSSLAPFTPPTPSVTIDLGDGVERPLRFTLRTVKRLKEALGGTNLFSAEGAAKMMDLEILPIILYHGLCDRDGNAPEGLTIEALDDLPAALLTSLVNKLNLAFFGPGPQKKEPAAVTTITDTRTMEEGTLESLPPKTS